MTFSGVCFALVIGSAKAVHVHEHDQRPATVKAPALLGSAGGCLIFFYSPAKLGDGFFHCAGGGSSLFLAS